MFGIEVHRPAPTCTEVHPLYAEIGLDAESQNDDAGFGFLPLKLSLSQRPAEIRGASGKFTHPCAVSAVFQRQISELIRVLISKACVYLLVARVRVIGREYRQKTVITEKGRYRN